jgi:hypothetical protein
VAAIPGVKVNSTGILSPGVSEGTGVLDGSGVNVLEGSNVSVSVGNGGIVVLGTLVTVACSTVGVAAERAVEPHPLRKITLNTSKTLQTCRIFSPFNAFYR